jgi:FeS assembly SUF system regulator
MFRITKLADYGMVLLIEMARRPRETFNPAELADSVHIPEPTVSKLLKRMTSGGLLRSRRGKNGGYELNSDPEQITLAQVLSVLEGPFAMTECSAGPGRCQLEDDCSIRTNWQQINDAIFHGLDQLSLAAMAKPLEAQAVPLHLEQ